MTRFRPFLPFLVLLPLFISDPHPQEGRFASGVSQSRLQKTVRDLVKFGHRMGGTQHGDRSAAYVAAKLQDAGLEVEIIEEPEKLVFTNEEWLLRVDTPNGMRKLIKNEWLAGYSPTVPLQSARLVYSDAAKDLDEDAYEGQIVLTDQYITPQLYASFVRTGARCILSYAPARAGYYTDWAMITSLPATQKNPIPLFNLSYGNGSRLREAIEAGTDIEMSFMTRTTIAFGRPRTVIATLAGRSHQYYIVCAHGDSDSGGPGADDNASGVATVIEIARGLSHLVKSRTLPSPEKTIKFIVWGIEHYSTEQFVRRHAGELGDILGVLNIDEVGTGATRNSLYFESNDVEHNERLLRTLNNIGESYAGKKGFWEEATTNPSQGGTDSYVFLPSYLAHLKVPVVKIPSVTIYTAAWNELRTLPQTPGWTSRAWQGHPDSVVIDYSAYYHSSLDVPALTTEKEPFNMVWATKALGIALLRLAW